MDKQAAPHEKVRFRHDDFEALEGMPSACVQETHRRRPLGSMILRAVLGTAAVVAVLVAVLVGTLYLAGLAGIGSERLRAEAEAAIQSLTGREVDVETGPARLSLDRARFVALEVPDIRLLSGDDGKMFTEAGSLRFGFHLLPLLAGEVELRSVQLSDARIVSADAPPGAGNDWSVAFRNSRGLIDPDLVMARLFAALDRFFSMLETRSTQSIELSNVAFVMGADDSARQLLVDEATIAQKSDGSLAIDAKVVIDGWQAAISGEAVRGDGAAGIASVDLEAEVEPPQRPASMTGRLADGQRMWLSNGLRLTLSGGQQMAEGGDRVTVQLTAEDGLYAMPDGKAFEADLAIHAVHVAGSDKIEVERLRFAVGRSELDFHGAVGPAPAAETDEGPRYRYEFVSDGSTAAAEDAPEPAVRFIARVAGTYDPLARMLYADEIGIRTGPGNLIGKASIGLPKGLAPSMALALDIPAMPVSHAKQLWPTDAARGARRWVMSNVFGGTVKNSQLRLGVPAGRLGNGVPLNGEEISGHFELEDTRFDVAGDIPPVRDAYGIVDFRGTGIDIALSSGTVYMPTGRTVAASNGTLTIHDAKERPLIGALDIDIAGNAPSVVELSSYKPIDAMRHLDFVPEDFEGKVEGKVVADIPLQRGIPVDGLDWKVDLAYEDLAIGKPVEGRSFTDAQGTIVVDPQKAVIVADARMDGAASHVEMTEPLGEAPVERRRKVVMTLDDDDRARLVPGLNTLLAGPVTVSVDASRPDYQAMEADLTQARLSIPWAGWSKGAGVAAKARFRLETDGATARLSDLRLEGTSFGATGRIVVEESSLVEAQFGHVALNRGDDISLSIARSGNGYSVRASGASLDIRPMIKLYLSETEKAEQAAEATPVTVKATLGSATGFGGERLSNLDFTYSGSGTRIGSLKADATTDGGSRVTLSNEVSGNARRVTMQSADAGAVLRFLDIYEYMHGGTINLSLAGEPTGPLAGQADARNFQIVNEPKLKSLVSAPLPENDGRSLNQVVRRDLDVTRAVFDRGFAQIEKGSGYLRIHNGVLRGQVIGATFQGDLYDRAGNMAMTGTFMPAYGFNRLFAEIPILGQILGNGRDRGLIGITFKLSGDAKDPRLQVNPISVIAPGIFRSIFEFD
ncbi:YhdP family protein [Mesorhizobium xinjiangense]|uniref:YhdP family protein n=1 Tax=Mesorhizobium xinjiangense TaxID=2678685 RepID=UPI0012EE8604|nr:DUF3971 domain-containing protein [Mesorhizobium xinjiangense]